MRLAFDAIRMEWRLQWRSLRFRVGAALYLLLCSAPPIALAVLIQPQSPHDFGAASYIGWVFDLSRFTGLLLAVVAAGNRTGATSQRQLWPVLSAAGTGNGSYLWLRWFAMSTLLTAVSLVPVLVAWTTVTALGLPPYDIAGYVVPWLLFVVAPMTMMAATWLAFVTIAGSELGALFLLYLVRAVAALFLDKVVEPYTGSTFAFDEIWLGFNRLQWTVGSILGQGDRWGFVRHLRSDSPYDIAFAVDWWLVRATPLLGASMLLLALAVFFVRRTRSDVRPLVLRDDHPLRNLLRFIHAARARYAPDAALGAERWRLLLGLLALGLAVFLHAQRQGHFETLAATRYEIEMHIDGQPTTPLELVPTSRTIEGFLRRDGHLETTSHIRFANTGDEPVDVAAFTLNAFVDVEVSAADLSKPANAKAVEVDRRGARLFVRMDPPVAPGGEAELTVKLSGRPLYIDYGLRASWGAPFAQLYWRHLRAPHHRSNIALSETRPAYGRRSFELGYGTLTPLLRYTSWQLTDPPTLPGERGLYLPLESVRPVEDLEIDLRLPDGIAAADACGHASIDDEGTAIARLRGQCRMAMNGYLVRGGPLRIVKAGSVVLLVQPGHEKNAMLHLPGIEGVIDLSAEAWPGLDGLDQLAALEWPPRFQLGGYYRDHQLDWDPVNGWTAAEPRIDGQLMSIPESRLRLLTPMSSVDLVGGLLTQRITEQRTLEFREQRIFRLLIGTAMAQRMGLAPESGATISGKPWNKFWAAQPILGEDRRHQMLTAKVQALTAELIARTGANAFYEGVNRFAADESEEKGTLRELFDSLEESSGVDLSRFWQQYFEHEEALPEMRLGEVTVRRDGSGFKVVGEIENTGTGLGRCPVFIKAEGQSRMVMAEAEGGGKGRFEARLDRQPLSVLLDPDKICYRWTTRGSALVERVALGETGRADGGAAGTR